MTEGVGYYKDSQTSYMLLFFILSDFSISVSFLQSLMVNRIEFNFNPLVI